MGEFKESFAPHVEEAAFDKLIFQIEITKACRFAASHRLYRRHRDSYLVISLFSLFVILLSLLPNMFELTDRSSQIVLSIVVTNSIAIIIFTLVDALQNYQLMAKELERCAKLLNSLEVRLRIIDSNEVTEKQYLEYAAEYEKIVNGCEYNHGPVDYAAVRVSHSHLFENRPASTKERFKFSVRSSLSNVKWLTLPAMISLASIYFIAQTVTVADPVGKHETSSEN